MKRIFLKASPDWCVVIILALITFTISLSINAPLCLPSPTTFIFLGLFYLVPFIFIGFCILLPLPFLIYRREHSVVVRKSIKLAEHSLCLCIILLLAFHIKLWVPLINPATYDQLYETIDRTYFSWVDPLIALRAQIHSDFLDRLYFNILTVMFCSSFIIHYISGHNEFRRVFLASILVQALGAVCYIFAPALGPFIYHEGANLFSTSLQHQFIAIHHLIITKGTPWLSERTDEILVSGLGAMPSLHVAVSVVFLYYALKFRPWLAWFYAPCCLWIAFGAMATRWHYAVDLFAGLALACLCCALSDRWLEAHESALAQQPSESTEELDITEPVPGLIAIPVQAVNSESNQDLPIR